MPYQYRDDIATADVAFEAWGTSVEEVFISAADATMNVMVEDLGTIGRSLELPIELEHDQLDLLLFSFLNELIFLKDARQLLLRVESLSIKSANSKFILKGVVYGEGIDAQKHPLRVDVKAVTLHRFSLQQTDAGWEAFVILDI
ncbi:MAG: archease [Syntrophorhabdales bacterium]